MRENCTSDGKSWSDRRARCYISGRRDASVASIGIGGSPWEAAMLDKPGTRGASNSATAVPLRYQSGFLGTHETEALEGALPIGRNSPQRAPYGLYAEQLSGTAFTAPRATNRRTWFYRIRPSALHASGFELVDAGLIRTAPCRDESSLPIGQMRWNPIPIPDESLDFLSGLRTITTCGDVFCQMGMASHVYVATR